MQTFIIAGTDLEVSRVAFGTMTFGSQVDGESARRMLALCFDRGVNFIDTANVYNKGASESMLGDLLAGRRQQVVLASKVFGRMGDAPDESGLSRNAILRAVTDSLSRLRTDYLDLYYLHQPDPRVAIEETLEVSNQLVREGKVRYIGVSNYASWQVCSMFSVTKERGWVQPRIAQQMYNLLARRLEDEFLPMSKENNLTTIAYNPLAGGLLSGKHTSSGPGLGTRFDANQVYVDRYWHEANFRAVERLATAASAAGRSLISVALNWLLHHTQVDGLILGASRLEQLEQNLNAVRHGPLNPDTLTACSNVGAFLTGAFPKYSR